MDVDRDASAQAPSLRSAGRRFSGHRAELPVSVEPGRGRDRHRDMGGLGAAGERIAPRVRIGRSRWFNLLWLLPISFLLLIILIAVTSKFYAPRDNLRVCAMTRSCNTLCGVTREPLRRRRRRGRRAFPPGWTCSIFSTYS